MGDARLFYPTPGRRPLAKWKPIRSPKPGDERGIEPQNVPWEVFLLCSGKDGIDVNTYLACKTVLDMDAVYDLLELQEVAASWSAAEYRNAKRDAGQ